MKFDEALNKFTEELKSRSRSMSTVVAYKKDIDQLNEFLKARGIDSYKKASLTDLQDLLNQFEEQNYTKKSISRKINSLRTFYRFLISEGAASENTAEGLEHPKIELKAPRYLKSTEYRALRDVTQSDKRLYAIVELLLQTGMRIGELARIRVEDLQFEKEGIGKIFIPAKGNEPARTVPFNQRAQEAVKRYLEERKKEDAKTDTVFITKTGRNFLIRNIRTSINKAFKKAGIKSATVNDLRHTFAVHQIQNGVKIKELYQLLGHKRATTTERYLEYVKPETEEEKTEPVEL